MTPRSPGLTSNPSAVRVVGPRPRSLGTAFLNCTKNSSAASSGEGFLSDLIVKTDSSVSSLTPPSGHPTFGNNF